jgi:GT2 family glycosyltransferase
MEKNVSLDPTNTQPTSIISPLPPTSLIICSRNRPKMLEEAVVSILEGTEVPGEIILIDQSDEPHPALCQWKTNRECEIRYIWTETVGLSIARNIGIKASKYNILAFTDDDVFVAPEWFGLLIRALLQSGPRSAVTGQVRMSKPEKPGGFQLAVKIEKNPAVYRGRIGKDVLVPLNMAMYRPTFDEIGFFDTRLGTGSHFPSSEDNDYGHRLLEAGYQIVYVPEAVLYHRAWRAGHDFYRINWTYGRGQGAYYAKYFNLKDPYMIGRMMNEYTRRLKIFPRKLREKGIFPVIGDAIFLAGVSSGALEWLFSVSWKSALWKNQRDVEIEK